MSSARRWKLYASLSAASPTELYHPWAYHTRPSHLKSDSPEKTRRRNGGRYALAGAIVALIALSSFYVFVLPGLGTPPGSPSTDACSLLTPAEIANITEAATAGTVPGLNRTAPPWDSKSIANHLESGWVTLCNERAFISAIQAHGAASMNAGGGGIDITDPDSSRASVFVVWYVSASDFCARYAEVWSIFLVNGTVTSPVNLNSACFYG
jgi:hypothetical protein